MQVIQQMRQAGTLWATLFALPALAVLIGLGTWQLQRKAWKDTLSAVIEERTRLAPRQLDETVLNTAGPAGAEYIRVRASGRFLHGQERHLYMPAKEGLGWQIITPLALPDGSVILVNRGWVPDRLRDPGSRALGQVVGVAEVVGLLRASEKPGQFTPLNEPANNQWYWRDIRAMVQCQPGTESTKDCRALGPGQIQPGRARHFSLMIDAEAVPANPGGWPRGMVKVPSMTNRHLEYALTWYGLALTLVGVWTVFVLGKFRQV